MNIVVQPGALTLRLVILPQDIKKSRGPGQYAQQELSSGYLIADKKTFWSSPT